MASKPTSAPVLPIRQKEVVALEHPMIIQNIDNGLKTLGKSGPYVFQRVLDSQEVEGSIPLYLRPNDITCAPIMSHNAATKAVLLKITVPRRTGRKRKRGSQDPFEGSVHSSTENYGLMGPPKKKTSDLSSHSRKDEPLQILAALRENTDKFRVEAVAEIENTHRFRGLSDFHASTTHGEFMTNMRENMAGGSAEKMRQFRFNPSRGVKKDDEIIPPPSFTDHTLPFNWGYHQNPNTTVGIDSKTGQTTLVNANKPMKLETIYIPADCKEVPLAPLLPPPPKDEALMNLIKLLSAALQERPIWSRRAILNYIKYRPGEAAAKVAFQYVGYQFRGGPWRDAIIRFGIDPRTDPQYKIYQTVFFQLYSEIERKPGAPWRDNRLEWAQTKQNQDIMSTHIFDGISVAVDGKIWQLCDITDPLLKSLVETPLCRETCDLTKTGSGWYPNGTWGKIRGIMKTKIMAIRAHKSLTYDMFEEALKVPDFVVVKANRPVQVPLPDMRLTEAEVADLRAKGLASVLDNNGLKRKQSIKMRRKMRIEEARQKTGAPPRRELRKRRLRNYIEDVSQANPHLKALNQTSDVQSNDGDDPAAEIEIGDGQNDIEDGEEDEDDIEEGHDFYEDNLGSDMEADFEFEDGYEDGVAFDDIEDDPDFHHRAYEKLKASYPG